MKKIIEYKYSIAVFIYILIMWLISGSYPPDYGDVFLWYDKLIHFLIFGLFALITYGALMEYQLTGDRINKPRFITAFLAVFFVTLYGGIDELHQSFVPYRKGDIIDLLADFLGAFIFVSILHLIRKVSSK